MRATYKYFLNSTGCANRQCAAMQADIGSLKIQVLNLIIYAAILPASITTSVTTNTVPSPSVTDVAHEVYLRSSKISNIVISGLQPSEVSNTT